MTNIASATIVRTTVRGNSVRMTNVGGSVRAGVGGISTDEGVSLVLRDSTIANNSVHGSTSPGAGVTAFAGGIELEGKIEVSGSRIIGNEVRAESPGRLHRRRRWGHRGRGLQPVLISDTVVPATASVPSRQAVSRSPSAAASPTAASSRCAERS